MPRVLTRFRKTAFFLALSFVFIGGQALGEFVSVFDIPPDPNIGDRLRLNSNTQLNLFDGGLVGMYFRAGWPDGTSTNVEVNVFGGSVGDISEAHSGSVVNISGGLVGHNFEAHSGSVVNISGGSVGRDFWALDSSTVNVSGGSIDDFFRASYGAAVNISGGSVGDYFFVADRSTLNISGGSFGDEFQAAGGSSVNIFGTQFVLDNVDITASLPLNERVTINSRNVTLSGLLADASAFGFTLFSVNVPDPADFFDPDAILTVTLVVAGDTNSDGLVNIDDLNNVRNNFYSTGPNDGALPGDAVPWDGIVDIDDLNAVRNNFGSGVEEVPEPSTLALATIVLIVAICRKTHRGDSMAK